MASDIQFIEDSESEPCVKRQKTLRQELLQEMKSTGVSDRDENTAAEIDNYLSYLPLPQYQDKPLQFWKEHSTTYPLLAQLPQLYFSISASSVAVESMFSIQA